MSAEKEILTVTEFAEVFGVSADTVTKWIKSGWVNGFNTRGAEKQRCHYVIHRSEIQSVCERQGSRSRVVPRSAKRLPKVNYQFSDKGGAKA